MNIDLLQHKNNNTTDYLNILNELGYISTINEPTRV